VYITTIVLLVQIGSFTNGHTRVRLLIPSTMLWGSVVPNWLLLSC